jgi:hypothetical protein
MFRSHRPVEPARCCRRDVHKPWRQVLRASKRKKNVMLVSGLQIHVNTDICVSLSESLHNVKKIW